MSLAKLDVFNVRNIENAGICPSPRLNFLVGPNGSGKTSLLEAIYILGRARSFRSTRAGQVISFQADSLTVSGRMAQEALLPPLGIGVQLSRRKREIVLSGRKLQSSAELIRAFPVLLLHPRSSALLDDAPKYRRQFLDWGVFHLDRGFLENWRGYVRALGQRNALLRLGDSRNIDTWNHELSRYGTIVAQARADHVQRLSPYFLAATQHFLGHFDFELRASAGWDVAKPLDVLLREEYALDRKYGYTHSGPHKGDFSILADGRVARNFLSRGQMKMLVFALMLAQAHLLEEEVGLRGCVLIDDLASELDTVNRSLLLRFLEVRQGQFFITCTDQRLPEEAGRGEVSVFHVEHGRVTQA